MKPLHTSYSNLGSWKIVSEDNHRIIRVVAEVKTAVISAAVLAILCFSLSTWAYLSIGSDQEGAAAIPIIGGLTGVIVPTIMLATSMRARSRGDLLTYSRPTDTLSIPQLGLTIADARNWVEFSHEHYRQHGRHFFELNLVLEGERIRFLSHNASNGFRQVLDGIAEMGLVARRHEISL